MRSKASAPVALGLAIRQFRGERGLSQEELAARAGLHRTYIGDIERGVRNPTLLSLVRMAEALEVNLSVVVERLETNMR